ncbi:MAG TPA: hypothetical protein VM512_10485 [Burkholderiaceae bacterium]|jgi:hypothetical protein|nr:hypothetical protein [Burkholderiaceae bacterium]
MLDADAVIERLERGTAHRGWIANSYAQIEFLLGDLIDRCRAFPQYAAHTTTISHSAARRAYKVRKILAIDGPLTQFAGALLPMLDEFEERDQMRNLLAHGFCEFHHTPDGDAGFVFRKFDRTLAEETGDPGAKVEQVFRLIDLEYHKEQMVHQAQGALELFHRIHFALGWAGEDPASMFEPVAE